jgi:DNA-binding NtrC family response regulator
MEKTKMNDKFAEKRRRPRVETLVRLRTTDPTKPPDEQVVNLNTMGMFIRTDNPYKPGQTFSIELDIPKFKGDPICVMGRVVWATQPTDSKHGGMGIEFINLPPRERTRLAQLEVEVAPRSTILVSTQNKRITELIAETMAIRNIAVVDSLTLKDLNTYKSTHNIDLVIFDIDEQEHDLKYVRQACGSRPLILLSEKIRPELRSNAISEKIYDLVEKPIDISLMSSTIDKLLAQEELEASKKVDIRPYYEHVSLVTRSHRMQQIQKNIEQFAEIQHPVLIVGENGVGKSRIARALHRVSSRCNSKFEVFDCEKYNHESIVDYLFGNESGNSENNSKIVGFLERAEDGVLLLDEVGILPMDCQKLLLEAMTKKIYRRLDSEQNLSLSAWIMATSKNDLRQLVRDGAFLEELYYQLSKHSIHVPALDQRPEDILPLAIELLEEENSKYHTQFTTFGPKAMFQLASYNWPGNIHELRTVIADSVIRRTGKVLNELEFSTTAEVDYQDKNNVIKDNDDFSEADLFQPWKNFKKNIVKKRERLYLEYHLERYNGSITKAADYAGISRQAYSKKLIDFRGKHKNGKKKIQ